MAINFTALATSALGFTIALAWNDAVSKSVGSLFPPRNEKAAARATLVYALVVTILVVFIVAVINHARKIVHKISNGGLPDPAGVQEGMRASSQAGPADGWHDSHLTPVVRLWEPRA